MKACNNKATEKKLTGKGEHMKLKENEVVLEGRSGKICIKRNSYGIPEIKASTQEDLWYGLGWVHACDRQLQMLLTRILLQGKAAEHLKGDPALIEIDKYMRRMNFLPDADEEIAKLSPETGGSSMPMPRGATFTFPQTNPSMNSGSSVTRPSPGTSKTAC